MVLNSWQRIDRILAGHPFGNGSAGNTTISSDPNTRATVSGSSGTTSLTLGSAILSNGDFFLLHQSQGTGVDQWEINQVVSGGGTTSVTCFANLQYTYGTGAQAVKFSLYDQVTISNFTTASWDGSTKGVSVIVGKTSVTGAATITSTGTGYRGGAGQAASGQPGGFGTQGESTTGTGTQSTSANNTGGGGGESYLPGDGADATGGGGGYATSGGNGQGNGSPPNTSYGLGGGTAGSADLTTLLFGGGGGGGGAGGGENAGDGGIGGGILIIITKDFNGPTFVNKGQDGGTVQYSPGGAGAGGSVLLVCQTATLGSSSNASGGTGGSGTSSGLSGGGGGNGRISVHHSGVVTGTTTPTFDDTSEPTLIESLGGSFLLNFI